MNKKLQTIFSTFALAFILLIPGMSVKAGTITSVSAASGASQMTVSGVAGDGVLSVAIFVYDSTGTELVMMESVSVDNSHAYSDTISVAAGTYVVKVADYEGGAFSETNVTVTESTVPSTSSATSSSTASTTTGTATSTVQVTAPKTGEQIAWTLYALAMIAMIGAAVYVFTKKKERK